MTKPDNEADAALANIRQRTTAPIQRFIDVAAANRMRETAGNLDLNGEPHRCRVAYPSDAGPLADENSPVSLEKRMFKAVPAPLACLASFVWLFAVAKGILKEANELRRQMR